MKHIAMLAISVGAGLIGLASRAEAQIPTRVMVRVTANDANYRELISRTTDGHYTDSQNTPEHSFLNANPH